MKQDKEKQICFPTLDLFSGIGGFSLGLERSKGFKTIAFCEADSFCQKVLEKHWPDVPIYTETQKIGVVNEERIREAKVICGRLCPKNVSITDNKDEFLREGKEECWIEFKRIIGEIKPRYTIIECMASMRRRELGTVIQDLWQIGYACEWNLIPTSIFGAIHKREKLWLISYPRSFYGGKESDIYFFLQREINNWERIHLDQRSMVLHYWLERDTPNFRGMADDVSTGMDKHRLKALGDAVVPVIPELIGRAIIQHYKRVLKVP